jgi:hypothetical protein
MAKTLSLLDQVTTLTNGEEEAIAGPATQGWVRLSTQQEQVGTSQMNFEETYEHYT